MERPDGSSPPSFGRGRRSSLNRGLSDELKEAYPEIKPINRPVVGGGKIQDPYWLAGFTSAEGSFMVIVRKVSKSKLGNYTQLIFQLAQHNRDTDLMKSIIDYLNSGVINQANVGVYFLVTKFSDICNIIIPFFDKFNIQGVKYKDYLDFLRAKTLIENKAHLTKEGLDTIIKIKSGMNRARMNDITPAPPEEGTPSTLLEPASWRKCAQGYRWKKLICFWPLILTRMFLLRFRGIK